MAVLRKNYEGQNGCSRFRLPTVPSDIRDATPPGSGRQRLGGHQGFVAHLVARACRTPCREFPDRGWRVVARGCSELPTLAGRTEGAVHSARSASPDTRDESCRSAARRTRSPAGSAPEFSAPSARTIRKFSRAIRRRGDSSAGSRRVAADSGSGHSVGPSVREESVGRADLGDSALGDSAPRTRGVSGAGAPHIEEDDPVEAFFFDRPDEAFGVRVAIRRAVRRLHDTNPRLGQGLAERRNVP